MAESDTLLASLVARFPGNTENIATEALAHIIAVSDAAREALNDVIQSGVRDVKPIQSVLTQQSGSDGTRPDLVCLDEDHKERVLVEVKFWAPLTDNQPNGYIERLPDDAPTVLMFLTPEERARSLWSQLKERVSTRYEQIQDIDSERKCYRIGDTNKHLLLVSWMGLLDAMSARVNEGSESIDAAANIRQLRALARYADSGAFKPVQPGERSETDSERRIRDYRRLIDDATDRGVSEGWANRKGLNRTPRSYGYGRYLQLGSVAVWFGVNLERFEKYRDTPLWLEAYPADDIKLQLLQEFCSSDGWIPVELKNGVEYSEALAGVVNGIKKVADFS